MKSLKHRFVERMPSQLDDGILYISIEYGTVLHRCACGCGHEVNTPLGRTDWSMTYDGETVSLSPSVGNWSFPCRSHYIVRNNRVHWAGEWSDEDVERGRRADRALKAAQNHERELITVVEREPEPAPELPRHGWWGRLLDRLRR